jgi:hypothetical protein
MFYFCATFQGWRQGLLIFICFFCVLNRLVSRVIKYIFCCPLLFDGFLSFCCSFMTYRGLFTFWFITVIWLFGCFSVLIVNTEDQMQTNFLTLYSFSMILQIIWCHFLHSLILLSFFYKLPLIALQSQTLK